MRILLLGDSITAGTLGASYVNILRERLPEHEILEHGKSGDTVVSLHTRLSRMSIDTRFDITVVFIGVNDVFVRLALSYRLLNILRRQGWSKTPEQFEASYRKIINHIIHFSERIIIIPPLFLGEKPENQWNRALSALSEKCLILSDEFDNVCFLDVRDRMVEELLSKTVSTYLPNRMRQMGKDKLNLTTKEKIDSIAVKRGLHFTIDGVHLNTRGAAVVADALQHTILNVQLPTQSPFPDQ